MIIYNKNLISFRYPIITIMGHVNHGKTSILECIKNSKDSNYEFGGITQNIKAYQVLTKYGFMVFIDTPGHDSFINMREKGSKITDIIILVISSDDGIKSQTIESINYINNHNIPAIIAINKIDKGYYNLNNIKTDLLKFNIILEEFGGKYKCVLLSSKNKLGIDELLLEINKITKNLNLKINYNKTDVFIIDSYLNNKKGPVLYTIFKNGYTKIGDFIVSENIFGKIKFIQNEFGKNINYTIPSLPSYIYGINKLPKTNDNINIFTSLKEAKKFSKNFLDKLSKDNNHYSISELKNKLFNNIDNFSKINYIIKTDTNESSKSIKSSIDNLLNNNVINIIYISSGSININDINSSYYLKSKLIGFNININYKEYNLIKLKKIFFKNFFIIYDLIDLINNDIKRIILELEENNYSNGLGKVCNIFPSSKSLVIMGCKVIKGRIKNTSKIKIIRNNTLLYNGNISSLKFFKNKIFEAFEGTECGILIKGNYSIKENDIIMSN